MDCERPETFALKGLIDGTVWLVTIKLPKACDVPFGVETVTVRRPAVAVEATVIRMGRDETVAGKVGSTVAVTPAPLKLTLVAPVALVRFDPLITAGTWVLPIVTALGYTALIEGLWDCV